MIASPSVSRMRDKDSVSMVFKHIRKLEFYLLGNKQLAEGDNGAVGCAIVRMLTVSRTLKVMDLSQCSCNDTVAEHTAGGLAQNKSLKTLNLNGNHISSTGVASIFRSLERNTSLEGLNLPQE